MDSLQVSELQTFINHSKGEQSSKKFHVDSIDCAPLDLLDPILERALDLSEYFVSNNEQQHNIFTPISSGNVENTQCNLPQLVLNATALVNESRYPDEGTVLPQPVVSFLEPNQSPTPSDVTSSYSDDSSCATELMPEFSQLTSPSAADAPCTSSFKWPNFVHVKQEDYGLFKAGANAQHHLASVPSSSDQGAVPFVTSPTTSLPSPTSTIYSASSPGTPGSSTPSGRGRRPHGSNAPYSLKSRRRQVEKGTQEYVDKRSRNNVAVRKSRAKAKEKQKETESRVKSLLDQNDQLQKKVDLLTKELSVLKGLFLNVGASIPDDFLKMIGDL